MERHSAARRRGRPFAILPSTRPVALPIGAPGIVGDGHFVNAYGEDRPNAALLLIPAVRLDRALRQKDERG